jgi:hypothetical protein
MSKINEIIIGLPQMFEGHLRREKLNEKTNLMRQSHIHKDVVMKLL